MLELIEIKGFRSFSQESFQKIDLQRITVIVGENDTGKSNILKAMQFVLNPSTENIAKEDFNIRKSRSRTGRVVDKKSSQITIKLKLSNKAKFLPKKFHKSKYNTKIEGPFIITCVASGHDRESYTKTYKLNDVLIHKDLVPALLSKIKCFTTPSIRDVNYLNELKKLPIEKSSVITQALKRFTRVVKGKVKNQESLFRKAAIAQKVTINPILKSEDVLNIIDFDFMVVKDDIPVQLKSHGQGMISKIIISLFLKRGRNYIVGIEEPEIHMHPNLIREIISECDKLGAKKALQIIIVTHSHYLTNFVQPKNILIARKDNKYTKIIKIMPFDSIIAQKIENNIFLNRQKTEILFARGVLFVEGPYDRRVFTAIDSLEKNATFNYGISIVEVASDGFAPYIELCIQSNIPWACIADSKAFYSPENNNRGSLLKVVEKYVNEQAISQLENKIKQQQSARRQLRTVNESLKTKKGYIANLLGGDISDTIIAALVKKNDPNLYKTLFTEYGGHSNVLDPNEIKNRVEVTIRKKTEEMIIAVQHLNKTNELHHVFKNVINNLIKLSGKS